MKKLFLICIFLLECIFASIAQIGADILNHHFNAVPAANPEADAKYKDLGGLYIIYHGFIDDNFFDEEGNLQNLYLNHTTIKFITDEYLETYKLWDKIDMDELYDLQARVIHPDGSMVYYTKDSIRANVKTNDKGKEDTTYALTYQALGVGDILERCLTFRGSFTSSGHYTFRHPSAHLDYEYTMMYPGHLKLDLSLYNSNATIIDTLLDRHGDQKDVSTRYIYIHLKDLPSTADQSHAHSMAYFPRLEYSIAFNLARSKNRITSTKGYLQDLYSYMHNLDKNDVKAAKAIAKEIKLTKNMNDEEKVRAIESHIKESYHYANLGGDFFRHISTLQSFHFGSGLAFATLYDQLFKIFKIDHQMVWTTDLEEKVFDKKFEGSNFYSEILYYLPSLDQYLDPCYSSYRIGLPNPSYAGNTGANLQEMTMGKASTYIATYKTIPAVPAVTFDSMAVNIAVNTANKTLTGSETRTMGGYLAAIFQTKMKDFELEAEESFIEHYLGFGNENVNISGEKYEHNKPADIAVNPLKLSARFNTADFATFGSKQLEITIGAFIGKQSECKDKGERTLPVEIDYPHNSYRLITLTIPEGYSLGEQYKTLDRAVYDTDDANTAQACFVVKTEVKGNQLLIHCYENYNKVHYEPSEYDGIRRIWDASFEFNKAKVIFSKN